MSELPAPVKVSPLIRFGRWSFLIAGILYGVSNQSRLSRREVGIREEEAKRKVIRDAKLAAEKKIANDAEMKALSEMAGGTLN